MTTQQDRTHLMYPDNARLKDRLRQAKEEGLILLSDLFPTVGQDGSYTWRAKVTPSEGGDPYELWTVWFPDTNRAYSACTCTAGSFGTPCKHVALLLHELSLIGQTAHRMLDNEEAGVYMHSGTLPEWREIDEEA